MTDPQPPTSNELASQFFDYWNRRVNIGKSSRLATDEAIACQLVFDWLADHYVVTPRRDSANASIDGDRTRAIHQAVCEELSRELDPLSACVKRLVAAMERVLNKETTQ